MTIARFPVPPIVKSVTVRAEPARAFARFARESPAGGRCRGFTPAPTRWTARSSRVSAAGSSNARPMGAKPMGIVLAYDPPIVSPFPGSSSCRPRRSNSSRSASRPKIAAPASS